MCKQLVSFSCCDKIVLSPSLNAFSRRRFGKPSTATICVFRGRGPKSLSASSAYPEVSFLLSIWWTPGKHPCLWRSRSQSSLTLFAFSNAWAYHSTYRKSVVRCFVGKICKAWFGRSRPSVGGDRRFNQHAILLVQRLNFLFSKGTGIFGV